MIKKSNIKITDAEKKLTKAEFIFTIDLKLLIQKMSGDTKLLQLKVCARKKNRKRELPKKSLRFLAESRNDSVCCLPDRILFPEDMKKPALDASDFGHPGLTRM